MVSSNAPDNVLLISCLGDDTGGGLFGYARARLTCLDRLSTTGLCVADDLLYRLLWTSSNEGWTTDLLVYDAHGVKRYHRLDAVADPHDIVRHGENIVIVATADNSLLWISPAGEIVRRWRAPGGGDSWHLNCLHVHDGHLFVSAFGQFRRHRQWVGPENDQAGIIFDVDTSTVVVSGLTTPHMPRVVDGSWIVCNSVRHELLQVNAHTNQIERRLELQSWTRGLAIDDDVFYVGESAGRHDPHPAPTSTVAVICRSTWSVVDRITLPCREIYDLVLAPSTLVEGVRQGFRTNTQRAAEQDQHALFREVGIQPARLWATGDPLPPAACRVEIDADIPDVLDANSVTECACTVENRGSAILVSAPPNPVSLSYKWLDVATGLQVPDTEGMRTRLPFALVPGHSESCTLTVRTPPVEGAFILRVTLVQEWIAWFDDIHPENHYSQTVQVLKADSPDAMGEDVA